MTLGPRPLSGTGRRIHPLACVAEMKSPGAWCPRFASVFWTLTWDEEHSERSPARFSLPNPCGPFGLDCDRSFFLQGVVTEAAPIPISRFLYQSALHGIAVQVSQLDRKLARISHIAVVVTLLPEAPRLLSRSQTAHSFGERQLQVVNGLGQPGLGWLTQEQVHMLRHDDISVNAQLGTTAHVL